MADIEGKAKNVEKPVKPPVKASAATAKKLGPASKISELTISELSALISAEVGRLGRGGSGSHVNSGPPGFVNGGGHANFDPKSGSGSHVNSGPPGFVNGGGHANFDPKSGSGSHVNSGPPGFVNGGGHANFDPKSGSGSHVNSGPPGFVNGGGHANFDPKSGADIASLVTLPDGTKVELLSKGTVDIRVRGFRITR